MLSVLLSSCRPDDSYGDWGVSPAEVKSLSKAEKALYGGKYPGAFSNAGLRALRPFGEVGLTFGDCQADRFRQVGVGVEEVFHRRVADFQNFCLLNRDHVRRARLAREEGHLAKEVSLG